MRVADQQTRLAVWLDRHEQRLRTAASVAGGIALGGAWIRLMLAPSGDFRNHRFWAERFLRGEFLYLNGANVPYLPFWALAHVPLALVPLRVAAAISLAVAIALGAAVLSILDRLTRNSLPIDRAREFWITAATVAITARFLLRDLADAGANLTIVGLVWVGLYAIWSRRLALACALIGLATALKLTPALFVIYFLLRRRFTLALGTLAFACLFSVLPAAWLGARSFEQHVTTWAQIVWRGVSQADPNVGVLGVEPIRNQALRPALGRLLTDPLLALGLAPSTIAAIVSLLLAGLLGAVGWVMRAGVTVDDPRAVWDWSAVLVVALLISPITWRAHAVAVIPACYLIVRAWFVRRALPAAAPLALVLMAVLNLLLIPAIAGKATDDIVHRWSLFTWGFVALLVATLKCRTLAAGKPAHP